MDLPYLRELVAKARWVFAKTMPENPHEYTLRREWESDEDFKWAVRYIREHGVKEPFKGRSYTVLYLDEFKYWTMGCPIGEPPLDQRRHTILINRKPADVP